MTIDLVLFFGLALISVVAAIAMIASRSAVYSALFLVLNFLTVATLYLLLNERKYRWGNPLADAIGDCLGPRPCR